MNIDTPIVLSPLASELGSDTVEAYDPTVRFIIDNKPENNNLPAFSVGHIVSDFNTSMDSIRKITLPVALFTKRRPKTHNNNVHTCVWETRYVQHNLGWAVIYGTNIGKRMAHNNILMVRYPLKLNSFQNGRRVLVSCYPGALMTIVNIEEHKEIYFTYRVDSLIGWPKQCTRYQPSIKEDKVAAVNMSLISVTIKDKFKSHNSGWTNQLLSPAVLEGIAVMQVAAKEAVIHADTSARYIEHFVSVGHSSKRPVEKHHLPPDSHFRTDYLVDPDDYITVLHEKLSEYRIALLRSEHKERNSQIPVNVTYSVQEQDADHPQMSIKMTLEVPSVLDFHPHFAIETEFTEIPSSLLQEPHLIYASTSISQLANYINQDSLSKNLYCKI